MATIVIGKNGEFDIEKGLEQMNWDTEAFERELEILARTQSPQVQEKIRKQYNAYMKECGWPMELVVVEEKAPKPKSPAKPSPTEPIAEPPKAEQQPETLKVQEEPTVKAEMYAPVVETASSPQPQTEPTQEIAQPDVKEPPPNETEAKTEEPKKELHGYVVMSNAVQTKELLKALSVLVDEATFNLTPKGLTTRGMDPSRIAMVDLVIPRENCTEHFCPEDMKFCFSVDRFLEKTLKNVVKDDGIRLDIQTGIVDKMNTRLFGKITRQFSMPLLEVTDEEAPVPKINFMYSAKLVLENVNTLFKDLEDHVRITGTQDALTFEQTGDIENLTSTFQKGDDTVLNIEAKQDAKATYGVSYLKEMLKALQSLTDIVEVSFSTDMPIRISADLAHLGIISFYLAPRLESD